MNATLRILRLATASLVLVMALEPATVASATSFTLRWTAPGDDSLAGRASLYDLRYSSVPLTLANFGQATRITGLPVPAAAGTPESFVVSGLSDAVPFYLAIKSADESGNWSAMSNVSTRSTQPTGYDPKKAAVVLSFSAPWPNPARQSVQWAYSAPQAAHLQVDVFDATGRHVHTVASGERGAGGGDLSWDLRDDRGGPVAAGVYFVKARIGATGWTGRVVVVR